MRYKGPQASRRAARERRDGVDELAQRAAAGVDLWTGGPPEAAPARSGLRWTAEEDELVRALPPEEAAARTGRSLTAVRARRRTLRGGEAG